MSNRKPDELDIVVGNFPADASLMNHNGVRTLFMRPQSFSSAVRHVQNVLPGIPFDAAQEMIRAFPEFKDFDDLLGLSNPAPPSVERPPVEPPRDVARSGAQRNWRRNAALVAALIPALAVSWGAGWYMNGSDAEAPTPKASAPDTAAHDATGTAAAPFNDSKFEYFSGSSQIECSPTSSLEAECTDSDGMVMSTKAATGPDSTIFTFSYGPERIGLRIFYDTEYATTWARQDGTQELYPNLRQHGRYILWGTDPSRIQEYMSLLQDADQAGPTTTALGAKPLPPRLAALTLGTLGLNDAEVTQIMARPAMATTDAPAVLAARLVLGLDSAPASAGHAGDDIVALAAGIEPNFPQNGTNAVEVGTTTVPAGTGSTPADGGSTTPTPPATTPSTDTKAPTPPPTPTAPPPVVTPPVVDPVTSPPSEPQTPGTVTPPVEETPTPTDPPAEEPPPVEETPAPTNPPTEEPPPVEPPLEETPAPVDPPVEESSAPPVGDSSTDTGGQDQGDELLILDSAWTVAA
ncbi:hypothetical protein ACFQ6U_13535 [Streptomyces sp. NPDC056465]|uniref:hypothetical protein n=1 Tax=Streptomyces sp. NPDC056465 TaxID=3345829 RepID=UPI0036B1B5E8